MEQDPFSISIIFVGDNNVGKTSVIAKWLGKIFNPTQLQTVGIELIKDKTLVINHKQETIKIWDIAGIIVKKEELKALCSPFFRRASIFVIVLSAEDNVDIKRMQIEMWRKEISDKTDPKLNARIIIIENKNDLPTAKPLNAVQRRQLNIEENDYLLISAKTGFNINKLDGLFISILKIINPPQPTKALNLIPPIAPLPQGSKVGGSVSPLEDRNVKELIDKLKLIQATEILQAINTLFESFNASYEIPFLAGLPLLNSENNIVPEIVEELEKINKAQNNLKLACEIIYRIYLKSKTAGQSSYFTWPSTKHFYSESVPQFIQLLIAPDTLRIKDEIRKMSESVGNGLLASIKSRLLRGTTTEVDNPYGIGMLGGNDYKTDGKTIKLPAHVFSMVEMLGAKVSHHIRLLKIFDDILAASCSINANRGGLTDTFYKDELPQFFRDELAKRQIPLRTTATVSSRLRTVN